VAVTGKQATAANLAVLLNINLIIVVAGALWQ